MHGACMQLIEIFNCFKSTYCIYIMNNLQDI